MVRPFLFRLANQLYDRCYPVYYPLYATWKNFSDLRERALLRQLIRPGMTVVDVGANIGIYTKFFSRMVGESGHVHAFEPAPLNFKRLQKHCQNLNNVSLNPVAVGKDSGAIRLFISEDMNFDHRTFDSKDGRVGISVPLVCLDDYFKTGQQVDFIKIDVQGYELSVLEGAIRVLSENQNVGIIMEFWPYGLNKAFVSPPEIVALIKSLGFKMRQTSDPFGELFDFSKLCPSNAGQYCNLILTRD